MKYFVSALTVVGMGALSLAVAVPTLAAPPSPPGTASLPVYKTSSPRAMPIKRPTINAVIVGDSDQSGDSEEADTDTSKSGRPEASKKDVLSQSEISAIQRALRKRGYYLEVSGAWDAATVANMKSLQYKHGLKVTGRPDRATLKLLGLGNDSAPVSREAAESTGSTTARTAGKQEQKSAAGTQTHGGEVASRAKLTREQVKQLQRRLSRQGYQVDQSGRWNNRTRSAIVRLQERRGLKQTGYPDRATRRALSITEAMWESWGGHSG